MLILLGTSAQTKHRRNQVFSGHSFGLGEPCSFRSIVFHLQKFLSFQQVLFGEFLSRLCTFAGCLCTVFVYSSLPPIFFSRLISNPIYVGFIILIFRPFQYFYFFQIHSGIFSEAFLYLILQHH
jgi:hypothetical protein